jgi:hypothetical protein
MYFCPSFRRFTTGSVSSVGALKMMRGGVPGSMSWIRKEVAQLPLLAGLNRMRSALQ